MPHASMAKTLQWLRISSAIRWQRCNIGLQQRAWLSTQRDANYTRVPITVTSLNEQGDGVGIDPQSGLQVLVPFAVPGDSVSVELFTRDLQMRQQWHATTNQPTWPLFGHRMQLINPSEARTVPRCAKFFGVCGGCKHQQLTYAVQLEHKHKRILELFMGQTHSPEMEIYPIIGVEDESRRYHYRNKMEFTCSTGRWLLETDKQLVDNREADKINVVVEEEFKVKQELQYPFTVGLFPVASTTVRRARQMQGSKRRKGKKKSSGTSAWNPRVIAIDECMLQDSLCNRILERVSTLCETAGVKAYDFHTHSGFLKQIVLRNGVNREGKMEVMIGLVTTTFDDEQSELLLSIIDRLVQEFAASNGLQDGGLVSIIQQLDEEAQRHLGNPDGNQKERILYGRSYLQDSILDHTFQVSLDSFFQPNSAQASVLYREIQNELEAQQLTHNQPKPIIWDLFCGVGSIGICMGALAKKVVGFEIVEAAVEKAQRNARLNGYTSEQMQFFCMDLTKRWKEEELSERIGSDKRPDLVIVDPPRAGLHSKLIKLLRRLAPMQICYVSCNPHTQVRDLELLCRAVDENRPLDVSYQVKYLRPVDMLPYTPHIETIAWLERR